MMHAPCWCHVQGDLCLAHVPYQFLAAAAEQQPRGVRAQLHNSERSTWLCATAFHVHDGCCCCCSCRSSGTGRWLRGHAVESGCPGILLFLKAVRMNGNQDIILYFLAIIRLQCCAPAVPFTGHAADTGGTLRSLQGPAEDGQPDHTACGSKVQSN
jgi:hypothetical protein